ncbi:hypothetical protein ACJX0J_023923, partial [Zea mays]
MVSTNSGEAPRTPATTFDGEQQSERERRARLWEGEERSWTLEFIEERQEEQRPVGVFKKRTRSLNRHDASIGGGVARLDGSVARRAGTGVSGRSCRGYTVTLGVASGRRGFSSWRGRVGRAALVLAGVLGVLGAACSCQRGAGLLAAFQALRGGDGKAALRGSLGGDDAATATAGLERSQDRELEQLSSPLVSVNWSLILSLHISWSLILSSPAEMDDVQEIEQRSQPQIFWTQEMSACALKYLDQLVADGIRVDKGFKSSHYNQCAKVVKERFQVQVSGSQVTNHLKTWRTRWSNICNYKKISSAHFDEQTGTILLDEKNYLERVQ